MKSINLKTLPAALMCALLASGCALSVPETKVYSLSPQINKPPIIKETSTGVHIPDKGIGIGPMTFPDQLKRPQIISRLSDNRLKLSEYHHWAGNLETEFLNTLVRNLVGDLGTASIYAYPWNNRRRPYYQVQLTVYQFDGELGGSSRLSANWSLLEDNGKGLLVQEMTDLTEPNRGDSYEALISAQSRLIEKLADQIAREYLKLRKN